MSRDSMHLCQIVLTLREAIINPIQNILTLLDGTIATRLVEGSNRLTCIRRPDVMYIIILLLYSCTPTIYMYIYIYTHTYVRVMYLHKSGPCHTSPWGTAVELLRPGQREMQDHQLLLGLVDPTVDKKSVLMKSTKCLYSWLQKHSL